MKARAAKIWAKLERQLVGLLISGSRLDVLRPQLIRSIGDELTGRAAAAESVRPPLPAPHRAKKLSPPRQARWPDTIHDEHLAALLERSCSRRMGYDGDDEVTYAGSR